MPKQKVSIFHQHLKILDKDIKKKLKWSALLLADLSQFNSITWSEKNTGIFEPNIWLKNSAGVKKSSACHSCLKRSQLPHFDINDNSLLGKTAQKVISYSGKLKTLSGNFDIPSKQWGVGS